MQFTRPLPRVLQLDSIHPLQLTLIAGLAVLVGVNLFLVGDAIRGFLAAPEGVDWLAFVGAADRIAAGVSPYVVDPGETPFRWSPLAAWILVAITPLGVGAWLAIQIGSLALLRDWRLIVLVALSWAFWDSVRSGNLTVLCITLGFAALCGSRIASWAYLVLFALIPRPVMAPLALWLVWRRQELRLPALGIAAITLLLVALTGWADEWLRVLLSSTSEIGIPFNLGPSRFLGAWWMLIGVPLAAWLLVCGRVGLAGLAFSPYLLPHYLMVLTWEVRREEGWWRYWLRSRGDRSS